MERAICFMKILIIQENGRHALNRNFRECFCVQRSLVKREIECDIWGKGHEKFYNKINFGSYDVIIDLENYDSGWVPDLSDVKAFKIVWSIDGHVKGMGYYNSRFQRNKCQLMLQATKRLVDKNSLWFPNCFDDTLVKPMDISKEYDVGFCGNILNRQEYIDVLKDNFNFKSDIFVIGNDMVKAINSYRIHFNKNISFDINYRSFETIGCGVVLATNYDDQYTNLGFVDGENCILYSNEEELVSKIKQVLNSNVIMRNIAAKGYNLSKTHTYLTRIKGLEKILIERV